VAKLLNISVVVIAVILSVEVIFDRVIPIAVLAINKSVYEQMVVDCEQARETWRVFGRGATEDKETDSELQKSAKVQLLSCLHQEVLKNKLLSLGVPRSSIRSLELEVISKTPDLSYDLEQALKG
jgi:hypothetical protein